MEQIGYIYGIVDPRTDVIFYVGKTIRPKYRLSSHMSKSNLKKKSNCCNYLNELKILNIVPMLRIISKCQLKNIDRMERKYISFYRKKNPLLTNERSGGEGWGLAKKLPPSNWNKAIESNKKPVIARNRQTGQETRYNSLIECAAAIGTSDTAVSNALKGTRNKTTKGYYIRYEGQEFIQTKLLSKFKRIDKSTRDIVIYNSWVELEQAGYDPSFVLAVCNGRKNRKTAYGFKWEKINGNQSKS